MNNSDQRRDGGQGDSGLPPGFIQQFVKKNGKKFSKHPNPPNLVSDFALGHHGCYLCGDDHVFRDCKRNNEPIALSKMRFDMHCHQPKMYFRLDRKNYNQTQRSHSFVTRDDRNKIPRFEDHTNSGGAGRGHRKTLPAWLTRQQDGNNQHNSFQLNYYQPNTPHNSHNSHHPHNPHNSYNSHDSHNSHSYNSNTSHNSHNQHYTRNQ